MLVGVVLALAGASWSCTTKEGGGGGGDDDCEDDTDCNNGEFCNDGECQPDGSGGSGAQGGSSSSQSQSGGGPGSGGSGATGGEGGCNLGSDGCIGCGEYITFPECTSDQLCSSSLEIALALQQCACTNCSSECASSACADPPAPASSACNDCVIGACIREASACSNDISD
jgi:hypothetical protein